MRLIKPLKPFFLGSRTHAPEDRPFEVDPGIAAALVSQGLAAYAVDIFIPPTPPVTLAVDPAPARAEQAVSRRQKRA